MHSTFLVTTALSSLTIAHLHVLISILFYFVFIFAATALGLEILAAGVGVFIFVFCTSGLFSAGHFLVFTFCFGLGLLVCELLLEMLFELHLFSTVVTTIIFNDVSLWLLGWKLGGC